MLKGIDVDKVEDPNVVTYVDFCLRCATVAEELGVSIDSNPDSTTSVVSKLDVAKLASSMFALIQDKGLGDAARLVVEAKRIRDQVPLFEKLDGQLAEKYGTR